VAVAEGAMSTEAASMLTEINNQISDAKDKKTKKQYEKTKLIFEESQTQGTHELTTQLEALTGLESRVTILGHVQRGGTPSPADRLLATRLGIACTDLIHQECFGIMVAVRGEGTEPVPLTEVVGKRKVVPPDHPWIHMARSLGLSLGD
jgi:6-phosphofructokinase 1